jgi:hypothetical protein
MDLLPMLTPAFSSDDGLLAVLHRSRESALLAVFNGQGLQGRVVAKAPAAP